MGASATAIPFERAVLRDGSVVHIRPIRPEDRTVLERVFEQLSDESRYRRFLHHVKRLGARELDYFTQVNHTDHEALVALGPHGTEPIGVARYVRLDDPECAEVAIAVVDAWQGRGVGTVLLHELVERAKAVGVRRFSATCLADNADVIDLLSRLGSTRVEHPDAGLAELTIDLPDRLTSDSDLYAALRHAAAGRIEPT
jgi:RimJ/RimL family protein N-acetyltransferase